MLFLRHDLYIFEEQGSLLLGSYVWSRKPYIRVKHLKVKQLNNKAAEKKPMVEKPTKEEPTEEEPTEEPTKEKRTQKKANEEKPTEKKPTEEKRTEKKPTEKKLIEEEPTDIEPTVSDGDVGAESKLNAFLEDLREVNDEVMQVEEIRSHTEKLKWDFICYLNNILKEYDLVLEIPATSLSDIKGLRAIFFNGTGIMSYHFKDESVKSFEMKTYPTDQLLKILFAAMPHLKAALKLKRKEYEDMSYLVSRVVKHIFKGKPTDWQTGENGLHKEFQKRKEDFLPNSQTLT